MTDPGALPTLDFVEALSLAQEKFSRHPMWKRLDGTPWQNDAQVIAATLMCDAVARLRPAWHVSEEGTACANCHDPAHAFEIPRLRSDLDGVRADLRAAEESREVWKAQAHDFASRIARLEENLHACAEALEKVTRLYHPESSSPVFDAACAALARPGVQAERGK